MKNKILSVSFFVIIISVFLINIFTKDKELSYTEIRKLNTLPKITLDNLLSGKTMEEFDNYTLDQFAFREEFRTLKTLVNLNIFRKLDNNNIFIKDDFIFKYEYPLKEDKVLSFNKKMNNLYDNYLKGMNVYYAIIPDKNFFLSDEYLKLDYEKLFKLVNDGLQNMTYIDITNDLKLEDYYYTDTHWRQDKILKVVETLSKQMHFDYVTDYKIKEYKPFYGVYYGQAALKTKSDTIHYLTNDIIDSAMVEDFDSDLKTVYEISSLGKMDSYDVFLSGATPLITITNKKAKTDKELIIFRDSFGSSLAPLLIPGYYKITLVDLRYINMSNLSNYIDFNNQDVLILYNTLIINNSDTIRN